MNRIREFRIWPRNMTGRIMLVTALGVLLVQGVNTMMRYQMLTGRAVIEASSLIVAVTANRLDFGAVEPADRLGGRPSVRTIKTQEPLNPSGFRSTEELAERLAKHLQSVYPEIRSVRLSVGPASALPTQLKPRPHIYLNAPERKWVGNSSRGDVALLSVNLADGGWLHSTARVRTRNILPIVALVIETFMIYLGVLIPLLLVIRQISKPLNTLNARLAATGLASSASPLEPCGPHDIRNLIESFNAAEQRVGAMLTEKDMMLGAIGHDLKTPLASLRVRIESVENADDREKMAATVDEMVTILDDILVLARLGKSAEELQLTDLGALVDTVISDLPASAKVSFEPQGRIVANIRPVLIRRALRNLIENALKYAGSADINTESTIDETVLVVKDNGPGIAVDRLDSIFEPFARGESSRNRESGGTGLGLTIARAIARAHGGDVVLQNREEGGVRAEIRLPNA
jgi:signal transduction histidine kinase